MDNDQAVVKFFGDYNRSLVTLSNCTLLTVKPPVTQKSKKGSYSTAMEEIACYIKKWVVSTLASSSGSGRALSIESDNSAADRKR